MSAEAEWGLLRKTQIEGGFQWPRNIFFFGVRCGKLSKFIFISCKLLTEVARLQP